MLYNTDTEVLELNVRELCNISCKCGSLGSYRDLDVNKTDRLDGDYIETILDSDPDFVLYREEELFLTVTHREITFTLNDVAFVKHNPISNTLCLRKILAVRGYEMMSLRSSRSIARLKVLSLMACRKYECDTVEAKLIYINSDNSKSKEIEDVYTADALEGSLRELLDNAYFDASFAVEHETKLRRDIISSSFPYESMRDAQKQMISDTYVSIAKGRRLIVQAPTGTGKTISTLYPSVKAIGDGYADKVFYLTAKSSTRREAYSASAKIFSAGAGIRTVVLYAKEQFCKHPSALNGTGLPHSSCDAERCEYARGYYDRVDIALREILSMQNGYNRSAIEAVALKYKICPYEFSLDLSRYCDIVICDYNYVFDPSVYLRRYFDPDKIAGRYVFLIDEAHNLSDRARDMYSAEISSALLGSVYSGIPEGLTELCSTFEDCLRQMYSMKSMCSDELSKNELGQYSGFYMSHEPFINLNEKLIALMRKCEKFIKFNRDSELSDRLYTVVSEIRKYLLILEYFDSHFVSFYEIIENNIKIKLICLDASEALDMRMKKAVSSILFSATLTPLEYFSDILGVGKRAKQIALPSPFDRDNLGIFVLGGISTRLADRDKSIGRIVSAIAATVSAKVGNYIVYFPSYKYMQDVFERFRYKYPSVPTTVQKKRMSIAQKEAFLASFKEESGKLMVGFCVLGGSFSEGVDLPGDRLIGSIIIGVGSPGISSDRNILKEYFDNKCEMGYDYTYTYPGMNNVLQAAGRVIRTEHDRGVVVLIDDRYTEKKYTELFPRHWQNVKYAENPATLAKIAADFWKKL